MINNKLLLMLLVNVKNTQAFGFFSVLDLMNFKQTEKTLDKIETVIGKTINTIEDTFTYSKNLFNNYLNVNKDNTYENIDDDEFQLLVDEDELEGKKQEFQLITQETIMLNMPKIIENLNTTTNKQIDLINKSLKNQNKKLEDRLKKTNNIKSIEKFEEIKTTTLFEKTAFNNKIEELTNIELLEYKNLEDKNKKIEGLINTSLNNQNKTLEEKILNRKNKK